MTMIKKSFLLFFIFICVVLSPLVFYLFKLPSEDSVKNGESLAEIFEHFNKSANATISGDDIDEKMVCLSCLPDSRNSTACNHSMAGYIAKNLITHGSGGMIKWHLMNFYLGNAIRIKYSSGTLEKIYFSYLANLLNQPDITSLCNGLFKKNCIDLAKDELFSLQMAFETGKFPSGYEPSVDKFSRCFEN